MEFIVKLGAEIHLPKLLHVMNIYEDSALRKFAGKIEEVMGLGRDILLYYMHTSSFYDLARKCGVHACLYS